MTYALATKIAGGWRKKEEGIVKDDGKEGKTDNESEEKQLNNECRKQGEKEQTTKNEDCTQSRCNCLHSPPSHPEHTDRIHPVGTKLLY